MNKPTMIENYNLLFERVKDSLSISDLDDINNKLRNIRDISITTGSGGSYSVAIFLAKVLNSKNGIPIEVFHPRNFNYKNVKLYKDVIACSYGGNNKGVDMAFDNNLKKYLFSSRKRDDIVSITYDSSLPKEYSFISLAATLIPISIILNYYLDNQKYELVKPEIKGTIDNVYEVITGYDTLTTSAFLESTFTESGLGIPVIHDKYDYCHGRTTLSYHNRHTVIYLDSNKELDKVIINELNKYYSNVIIISSDFEDGILRDYDILIKAMYLVYDIALKKDIDLSKVEYSPFTKKLYYYKGEM